MNKKIWVYAVLLLLCLFSASAFDYIPVHYYQVDSSGIDTGRTSNSVAGTNSGFVPGRVDNAVDFNDASSQSMSNASFQNQSIIRTIDLWYQPSSTGGFKDALGVSGGSTDNMLQVEKYNDDRIYVRLRTGASTQWEIFGPVMQAGDWAHIVVVMGSGGAKLYVNNTLAGSSVSTSVLTSSHSLITLGQRGDGSSYWDGLVDNVAFFEEQYSVADVAYSWNNAAGRDFLAVKDEVELLSPVNSSINNTFNITFKYNATFTNANPDSAVLYTNVSGSWAATLTNNSIINGTNNFVYDFDSDTEIIWNVGINDTAGTLTFAPNNYSFTVDSIQPTITVGDDATFSNSYLVLTNVLQSNSLTGWINISDLGSNLFSVNISIPGERVIFNITNINNGSLDYYLNHTVTDLAPGAYNLSIYAADGHTAQKIPDYKVKRGITGNKITYEFDNKWFNNDYVSIKASGYSQKLSTKKQYDRYTWTYEPGLFDSKNSVTFDLQSNHEIIPVENSKYAAHFVIPALQKWVDYELYDQPNAKYHITKINKNHYIIKITGLQGNSWTFHSIGDLNVNSQNYTFYVGNLTQTFEDPVISGIKTQYNLSIQLNGITLNQTPTATLEINETTNYTATLHTYTNQTVLFNRNITYNQFQNNGNITHKWHLTLQSTNYTTNNASQEYYDISVSTCASPNIYPIVNYTYYNELNSTALNTTHVYDIAITDGTYYYNQTGAFTADFNNQFCTNIDPNNKTLSFTSWGSNTLSSTGYVTRVIDIDAGVPQTYSNNPTTNISYALIPTAESTTVTYNWLTTDFQVVDGTMRIYKCNDDGSKSLVESIPIISGVGTANIALLTTAYSYDIIIDEVLYQNTDSWTRCHVESSSTITLYVDIGTESGDDILGILGSTCSLTKTTANNTVRMTWTPSSTSTEYVQGCVVADRISVTGNTRVYNNCSVEGDGYTRVVTVPDNGNAYVIGAYLKQDDLEIYCQDTVTFDPTGAGSDAVSGLIAVVFLIVTLALIYSSDGVLMLFAAAVALTISFLLALFTISWYVLLPVYVLIAVVSWIGRYSRKP